MPDLAAAPPHIADPCPAGRPIPADPAALLHTSEAAYLTGLSPRTLEKLRLAGGGCPFVQLGRAVRYRRRDLLEWIGSNIRLSTTGGSQIRLSSARRL